MSELNWTIPRTWVPLERVGAQHLNGHLRDPLRYLKGLLGPVFVENDLIRRVSYEEYRDKVRDVYGGPQGALLATASLLSLHIHLGDRLLRERKFDLRGAKNILDVGSGAVSAVNVGAGAYVAPAWAP